MTSNTTEEALENLIEKQLHEANGFEIGDPNNFDKQHALDLKLFWQFLENTQKLKLERLQKHSPQDWQRTIIERYDRLIKKNGILALLKKGLDIGDVHLDLMYPLPLASSSQIIHENFEKNIFSVTRQVTYSIAKPLQEIDMVIFLNGIPLITLELKNIWTQQTARFHGQKQYREDRDPNQPLLNFARSLVHMAVDTDEVYMTTKLKGKETFFLPFNKGNNLGQGNPPNPNGHRTAYLWEEVFTKVSLANIIQHFVRLDGDSKDKLENRSLFFPRYHQLDVVRKIINDVEHNGVGQTYLIQHSAGSGKSNSITWAAYQLIEAYPLTEKAAAGRSMEEPIFDSVIVVTDRRLLDKQIKDNINSFSEVKNIIEHANKSQDLKAALENGKKIIITTIQKFPFIIDGISDLSDKRFAVIIDEAHSSQSGSAHDNMNRAMGKNDEDEYIDAQDKILELMKSRKMRGNASYLAFTATPKNNTLEKFGEAQEDGSFIPFHLYSMKQAIEEGFILDVLANYTTYKSYYEIQKSIEDNPTFDSKKAQKKLRSYVEGSQQTIDVKASIMLDHFTDHVVNTKKLKGKGKGVVVTQSIESAIRYYKAIDRILKNRNYPFKVLIAFSGMKEVDGIEYTESDINNFPESETAKKFDNDENRLLVVANKYLTGFDQPKLCTMYVDKKLTSVLCVQALSRLNRSASKYGKRTEDLAILDFFNTTEDVAMAFAPFYTATTLSKATDVNVLHDLKDLLDEVGIYEQCEVDEFVRLFFTKEDAMLLSPIIDVSADRFNEGLALSHEDKVDFKVKAKQFVKIYGQMAAIMPYEIVVWEKLFWFLKFLVPKLIVSDPGIDGIDELLESVDLSSYGLQRVSLNSTLKLSEESGELDPQNSNPRGAHNTEEQQDPIDEIIQNFNEKWFQSWALTPEEQRVKFVNIQESVKKHPDYAEKYQKSSDPHHRDLVFAKMIQEVMLKRRKDEMELYRLYMSDEAFRQSWIDSIQRYLEGSL